ncbi:unnamed protein product [Bursaphelenchus xylophilus]|uniref:Palmitoyltransferase n=1 Tax=Bursaphelenchus xylophilus TaxID=6326 RepID=A0A1I7SM50_BURXY|nr:unnamed protein product [Bursaphelenchus xylophilus]CAG9129998.1 unnamed protein product [Bursaphelenchus xylophilus]
MRINSRTWKYWCANFSGVLYSVIVIFGITLLNLFYTCPGLYGSDACYPVFWHAFVILSEILVNLYLFHYYNVKNQISYWTVKSSVIPKKEEERVLIENEEEESNEDVKRNGRLVITKEGVYRKEVFVPEEVPNNKHKYCMECKQTMPRRSHHCPLCEICVLRKDHHCFLTGGCVGLANQRFFIVFLIWACIGSLYGSYFTLKYIHYKLVNQWFPYEWLRFVAPIALVRWFFGYDTLFNMMFSVLACASVATTLASAGFFGAQMFYTLQGYTMHDYHVGRLRDRLESDGNNYSERLALVFGKRWWLNFLIPQIWLPNQMTPEIAKNIFVSVSKDL